MAISFDTERQRLNSPECYHNSISEELRPKRDKMAKFLEEVGMVPTMPEGGYFMIADFSSLRTFTTAVVCYYSMQQLLTDNRSFRSDLFSVNNCCIEKNVNQYMSFYSIFIHDYLILHRPFPIGGPLEPSLYLCQFQSYSVRI